MTNGDYCVPGNAVHNVKMILGMPFPGAGNDPWSAKCETSKGNLWNCEMRYNWLYYNQYKYYRISTI